MKYMEGFTVIAISANFYGALAAGVVKKGDPSQSQEFEVKKVLEIFEEGIKTNATAFKEMINKYIGKAEAKKDMNKAFSKVAKNMANLKYLSLLYKQIFKENVKIRFARDWEFKE